MTFGFPHFFYLTFNSLIYFQAFFPVLPLSTYFFIIYAFCFLSVPPILSSSPSPHNFSWTLTIPFITVCYPQHILLHDTVILPCLPATCAWYPPHMHIFLQLLLVALGLG